MQLELFRLVEPDYYLDSEDSDDYFNRVQKLKPDADTLYNPTRVYEPVNFSIAMTDLVFAQSFVRVPYAYS